MPLSNFKISLKELKKVDKWMIISIILITSFGIVNIYLAKKTTAGGMLFPVKQSVFFIASLVLLYFVLAIDYSIIKAFTPIFYWGSIALLVLVLIIGSTINGAQGWIRLGPLSFQPAELAKIGTIMMMGKKLDDMDGEINNIFLCYNSSWTYSDSTRYGNDNGIIFYGFRGFLYWWIR